MGVSDHQDLGEREVKETALGVSAGVGGMARTGLAPRTPKPNVDGDGEGGERNGGNKGKAGAGAGAGGTGPTPDGGGQTDNKAADNINTSQPTTGGGDKGKDGV